MHCVQNPTFQQNIGMFNRLEPFTFQEIEKSFLLLDRSTPLDSKDKLKFKQLKF